MFIIIGAIFYGIQNILYSLLIAMRKLKIQALIYIFIIIYSIIIFNYYISKYSIQGASIAYLIIMATQLIIYIIMFIKFTLNKKERDLHDKS